MLAFFEAKAVSDQKLEDKVRKEERDKARRLAEEAEERRKLEDEGKKSLYEKFRAELHQNSLSLKKGK